jgi:hypothetical protein
MYRGEYPRVRWYVREGYLGNIAASRNAEAKRLMPSLLRVVRLEQLTQAVRLYAHDIVDPTIKVGAASEHFDSYD